LNTPESRILKHLIFIYGEKQAEVIYATLMGRLDEFRTRYTPQAGRLDASTPFSEKDSVLITYGDQFQEPGIPPLRSLTELLKRYIQDVISSVHILPFYPYSSDDGFSVIDFYQVDPDLGTWDEIADLADEFQLMFDAVVNHISSQSEWFQGFKRGDKPYSDYFITVDPGTDLSQVVRPRALPLLTPVETSRGLQHVWTTFSDDQIDLNYANPEVLIEMIEVLLFYVERGAEIIRLDAIAYLWKEIGTPCLHLPETHSVVKLMRAVMDSVAPSVLLITETNVPHEDNISYFGELLPGALRTDEAQMVYQFPLAPLILHTFHQANTRALTSWAASLSTPSPGTTFFNFIASHDGIGVNPARGLLAEAEIQSLVERTKEHGGQVSYKTNPDGSKSVYELNITLYDALNDPGFPQDEVDIPRFMASQVIMLSLAGVPGIYVHSLLGSRNCQSCVEVSGRARSINREKFQRAELEAELSKPGSRRQQTVTRYQRLLRLRMEQPAFNPSGQQQVLDLSDAVFALLRTSIDGKEKILCLVSVSPLQQEIALDLGELGLVSSSEWWDLIGEQVYRVDQGSLTVALDPYQAVWLTSQIPPGYGFDQAEGMF
jgi:glucosylglycerate phosphorylase